jgi:hypothetical protein
MNSLRFRTPAAGKSSAASAGNQILQAVVNQLKHDSRHVPLETLTMNNPFPAETPDPNIDNPVIPPSDPQPVPEQEPPGSNPPPREEPPTTMPPVIVTPE